MDLAKVVNLSQCVNTLSQSVLNAEDWSEVGKKTRETQILILNAISAEFSHIVLVKS